jgi:antitoxin component HigA of HigAB toxin-antitoxin module
MNIAPIKTQRDYRHALKQIERLMMAKRGTAEGDCLDVLVTLVEAWERRHYPLDLPDPVEAMSAERKADVSNPTLRADQRVRGARVIGRSRAIFATLAIFFKQRPHG